ncbi:oxidoreductase [Niveomyces insectorum RCEF 264]|uniref:Oxidoreductase n=1 Tax=Niveomyces insectorum RCEF 264 TaxID=1081102 RepID=A0A167XXP8_9HYPO|nr:oxidoreductase [Niveomyces insectorum RCEF 264]
MAPLDILIVGCSIGGPALATFLLLTPSPAANKPRITVLERSSSLRGQGQNVDVRGVGVPILRKLGVEAAVRASTTGEVGVQWVTKDNRVWATLGAGNDGDDKVHNPTSDIEIKRGRLAEILWQRSQAASDAVARDGGKAIEYIFGDHLDDIRQSGDNGDGDGEYDKNDSPPAKVTVHFANSGQTRMFDLVVGADGLPSSTRQMVWGSAGETQRVHRLGLYAAFFSIPRTSTDTAYRRCFHTHGRRLLSVRPDEQNNQMSALLSVVVDDAQDARFAQHAVRGPGAAGTDAQKALIKEYFQGAGWESERILQAMMATPDFYYSMIAQVKMDRWSKGRVVLLGDAAHCASHLSGMGTTLAMLGAYNLAGALASHPDDLSAAFAAYEASTRPAVTKAQKLMPGILRIMNPETAWGVWVVDTVIRFLVWSRVFFKLLLRFRGPDTEVEALPEYGFTQLPEQTD